jgi:multicomponent Na+:H+ antiporter subunit G
VRLAVVIVLLVISLASSISGAVGLIRLPDTYLRIQASSKTVTVGALPLLVAVVVAKGFDSVYAARALIVAVLLLVMNPLATHALARAAYKAGVPMWTGAVTDQARPAARDEERG